MSEQFEKLGLDTEALEKNSQSFFNTKPEGAPFLPQQPVAETPKVEEKKEEVKAEISLEKPAEEVKVEAPKVETQAEPVKEEVKVEADEKAWWNEYIETPKVEESQMPQVDEVVLSKYAADKYGDKLKLAQKVESNPLVSQLVKVMDDPDFDVSRAFTPAVDYNTMPIDKMYEMKVREEYGAVLNDEEVQELVDTKMEAYESMKPAFQKVEHQNLIKSLPKTSDPKDYINQFLLQKEEKLNKEAEFWTKVNENVTVFAKSIVGKELIPNVKVSEQDVEKVLAAMNNPNYYYNPDGSYNHQKEVMNNLLALKVPEIMQNAREAGKIEAVMERTNASPNSNTVQFTQGEKNPITPQHESELKNIQMNNSDPEVREQKIKEYKDKFNLG